MNQIFNNELQKAGAGLLEENARRTRITTNLDIFDWFFSKAVVVAVIAGVIYLFFEPVADLMRLFGF